MISQFVENVGEASKYAMNEILIIYITLINKLFFEHLIPDPQHRYQILTNIQLSQRIFLSNFFNQTLAINLQTTDIGQYSASKLITLY